MAKKEASKKVRTLLVTATRDFSALHKGDTYMISEGDGGWALDQHLIASGYLRVLDETETEVPDDGKVRTEHGGDQGDTGTPGATEGTKGLPKG